MNAPARHPDPSSGTEAAPPKNWRQRLRGAAKLGFWFFFIKGMLWLLVPLGAVWLGVDVF